MLKLLKAFNQNPTLRYLTPFAVFSLLSLMQDWGNPQSIFWIYAVKTLITGAVILYCFQGHWGEIGGKFDWRAVGLGILVFVIWVAPEILFPEERAITYNPNVFKSPFVKASAISFRMFGACVIVPFVEEILWRGFLMRYLIRQDFTSVSLGTYTHLSFWITAISFGLMHASWEWGVAIVTGILYGAYLVKTHNLRGVILAHAATNLCLGLFVLATDQWKFW